MSALVAAQYGAGALVTAIMHPLGFGYFPFQPVLHNWFIKGCGICCPVCGKVHIFMKDPLLLIRKCLNTYLVMWDMNLCHPNHPCPSLGRNPMCTQTYFNTKEDPPQCEHCQCRLTVRHILVDCPHLEPDRHGVFDKEVRHMRRVDGFWGLYKGVFPRVVSATIGNIVQSKVMEKFKEANKTEEPAPTDGDELVMWMTTFCKEITQDTVGRCLGIIVTHPLHVVMIRCMVQFVGKETLYNSIFSSIGEIYRNDGILGFFSGLVPRLIGEVITVWISNFLAQLINKYLVEDKEMKAYTGAACGLVISHVTYPFSLVSNIMTVNSSGLKAMTWRPYSNWMDCWSDLCERGELKRGSSLFWRYYTGAQRTFRY